MAFSPRSARLGPEQESDSPLIKPVWKLGLSDPRSDGPLGL